MPAHSLFYRRGLHPRGRARPLTPLSLLTKRPVRPIFDLSPFRSSETPEARSHATLERGPDGRTWPKSREIVRLTDIRYSQLRAQQHWDLPGTNAPTEAWRGANITPLHRYSTVQYVLQYPPRGRPAHRFSPRLRCARRARRSTVRPSLFRFSFGPGPRSRGGDDDATGTRYLAAELGTA